MPTYTATHNFSPNMTQPRKIDQMRLCIETDRHRQNAYVLKLMASPQVIIKFIFPNASASFSLAMRERAL